MKIMEYIPKAESQHYLVSAQPTRSLVFAVQRRAGAAFVPAFAELGLLPEILLAL